MFSGIVEEIGLVISVKSTGDGKEISLIGDKIIEEIKIGDSIAVDGVCLTIKKISGKEFLKMRRLKESGMKCCSYARDFHCIQS